jgi:hypothetical protein
MGTITVEGATLNAITGDMSVFDYLLMLCSVKAKTKLILILIKNNIL